MPERKTYAVELPLVTRTLLALQDALDLSDGSTKEEALDTFRRLKECQTELKEIVRETGERN